VTVSEPNGDEAIAATGPEALKALAARFPNRPGVYRFLDQNGQVLYVGKARDLRKRVLSYFVNSKQAPKIRALTRHAVDLAYDVTHTENEALILESTLIKKHRPRYNVVLRDDKSYPFIYVSTEHPYPRLAFHRGARGGRGRYFGPYPNAGAVRATLTQLQKLFKVRLCEDSYFENRTRPCLQHQIDRCTAPCVGLVDDREYLTDIDHAILFLEGRSQEVIDTLAKRMEAASEAREYERAARFRDQIRRLQRVQQGQTMVSGRPIDADVFAAVVSGTVCSVRVDFVRGGHHLGGRTFHPPIDGRIDEGDAGTGASMEDRAAAEILNAFVPQYYFGGASMKEVPEEVILSHPIEDTALVEGALVERGGHPVALKSSVRSERARWIEQATNSARLNLAERTQKNADHLRRLEALRGFLDLPEAIARIECFDISHTRGEGAVASCVVFDIEGARSSDYRRFNIGEITPGDDYAAMHQALTRRYRRILEEEGELPDVVIVDGGRGQLKQALEIAEDLAMTSVTFLGVAKGPTRKAGLETLFLDAGERERILPGDSPALHLIQQVRDEAHRFAITGHRKRRAKARAKSSLEDIPGVGAKRRQALIRHFGGLQGIARAGVDDLARVPGISSALAREIYDALHG